jgi:hypothetical protein
MKRLKMLFLIVNQLHFLEGRFSGYVEEASEQELERADVILTTLETAGMLPPAYEKFVEIDYKLSPTGERVYCKRQVNEWEDEG